MSKIDEYPSKLTDGYYHVRLKWEDEKSQVGQYKLLKSAVAKCDTTPGAHVFTEDGTAIYPAEEEADEKEGADRSEDIDPTSEAIPGASAVKDDDPVPVLYGRIQTLLNVRDSNSVDAKKVAVLRKGVLVEILEVCENGWYRIATEATESGSAYISNGNGKYVKVGSSVYTVAPTDTLWRIAEKTLDSGQRYEEIKALNGLTSNMINIGMELLIP